MGRHEAESVWSRKIRIARAVFDITSLELADRCHAAPGGDIYAPSTWYLILSMIGNGTLVPHPNGPLMRPLRHVIEDQVEKRRAAIK